MSIEKLASKNDFLRTHLDYVENTESPIIMHIWGALVTCAACLGRHAYLKLGIGNVYPNMFCLLVGPPGTRKNAAIKYPVDIMKQYTNVKMAPDDTGGQRQGLIAAIQNSQLDNIAQQLQDPDAKDINLFGDTSELDILNSVNMEVYKDDPDIHTLFICATEFGSFLGQGSLEMTRFLNKMWDGEDYKYKIRKEHYTLKNALLNLLGGTTSADLATLLPAEAIGQGFMSRIVLVYAAQRGKRIPPSKSFVKENLRNELGKYYENLFYNFHTEMSMSKQATDLEDNIYNQDIKIPDTRFIYYSERRHAHLEKLAMVLAATNDRTEVNLVDIELANEILLETEKYMPDALGEYGLSPIAIARQKMLEFIQHANGPVRDDILWAVMRRDMRLIDFKNAIADLINAQKIIKVDVDGGQAFVFNEDLSKVLDFLVEDSDKQRKEG